MGHPPSVRTQLLVLELGIALPLLGLIALLLFEFEINEDREARNSTIQLGQLAAADAQAFVHDVDATLANLAKRPWMQAARPTRCDPVFGDYLPQHSQASDLILTDPQGRVLCSAKPRRNTVLEPEVAACLDDVWRTRRFSSSRPFFDAESDRWSLARARPVFRGDRMVAVLATSVDLTRLRGAISRVSLPAGATISILDRHGAPVPGAPEAERGAKSAAGAVAPDGGERFFATATIPELGWTVYAGIPVSVAMHEHRDRVIELVTLCIVLLTLATALALFVSAEIARPIQALSAATRQAAAGKLEVRAPIEGSAETAEVARDFNSLLAARAEVEEALRQSALRLRLAIQVADVGLWEVDLHTREAFYSPEWRAQLGERDEARGEGPVQWRERIHPQDRERVIAREEAFIADPQGHLLTEFRMRHRDGSYRWILSRVDVLRDPEGRPLRLVGCHLDVTALKGHHEKERRLEERLRRAEQMSAMGALVAGVAHEVRNPLFGITATVDALEARAGVDGHYAPYLRVLHEQAGRLARLMVDLLEYGRLHELKPEMVSTAEPAEDARRQCAQLAHERGISIVSRVVSQAVLQVDLERVSRALRNLIENAIQFSPPGQSVVVEAREIHDDGGNWLAYDVRDHGPGFREEDLGQVLEPFFSRRRGGTGLGLAIARRIAEEHGGTVQASNRPGGGAVVTLRLPVSLMPQVAS